MKLNRMLLLLVALPLAACGEGFLEQDIPEGEHGWYSPQSVVTYEDSVKANPEALKAIYQELVQLTYRVEDLERDKTLLENRVVTLESELGAMVMVPENIQYLSEHMRYSSFNNEIRIHGINLIVSDGEFEACDSDECTGTGNIIVGGDEITIAETASNNLIIGREHTVNESGSFVSGIQNTINGAYGSICGGLGNEVAAPNASIGGGSGLTNHQEAQWVDGASTL